MARPVRSCNGMTIFVGIVWARPGRLIRPDLSLGSHETLNTWAPLHRFV